MWYFAWILGVCLAVAAAVLNGIWHEFHSDPNSDLTLLD